MLKDTKSFMRHLMVLAMIGILWVMCGISAYADELRFDVQKADPVTLTFLAAYAGIIAFIAIVAVLFQCIARMFLFKKAGVPSWKAWIPFYSDYMLFKITSGIGWLFLIPLLGGCIPVIGAVVVILARVFLAASVMYAYSSSWPFAVLYFVVPPVAELIFGVNKNPYVGPDLIRQKLNF